MLLHVFILLVNAPLQGVLGTACIVRSSTMTATNHDDQLGEIYPTMLNELNCKFWRQFITFSSLWPSWFVAVMV